MCSPAARWRNDALGVFFLSPRPPRLTVRAIDDSRASTGVTASGKGTRLCFLIKTVSLAPFLPCSVGRNRMRIKQIQNLTSLFRMAIDSCMGSLRADSLANFPHGSCGDVSSLLGMYLEQVLNVDVECVAGVKGVQRHTWIECNGVIVDITSDQFAGIDMVIGAPNSEWHEKFSVQTRRRPCVDTVMPEYRHNLEQDFKLICDTARQMT